MEFQKETDIMKKSYLENNFSSKCDDFVNEDNEIANYIKQNLTTIIGNDSELWRIIKKIIPKEKIIKDLITYEFLYSVPDSNKMTNDMEKIILLTTSELSKYQGTVGGFNIEDNQWLRCSEKSRFKIKKNQICIYNSITKELCYDPELIWFLKYFVRHMNKYLLPDSNIDIDYKLIDDEDHEICWILILFRNKN